MEKIKSQDRILGKLNGKEPPIISSRLPAAFSKIPLRVKSKQPEQITLKNPSEQRLRRLNSITQEDLSRFEEQAEYKKVSKLLTPINVDFKRKAKMEKMLNKIMQGIPDFSFNVGKQDKQT